jgi:hypothetical protein
MSGLIASLREFITGPATPLGTGTPASPTSARRWTATTAPG